MFKKCLAMGIGVGAVAAIGYVIAEYVKDRRFDNIDGDCCPFCDGACCGDGFTKHDFDEMCNERTDNSADKTVEEPAQDTSDFSDILR